MALLLAATACLAAWTRVQYIELYGTSTASYISWANEHYFGGLSSFYLSIADSLAAGAPYTTMQYPPGYPYFLAALKALGLHDVFQLRVAQALLDAAAVVIVFRLASFLGATRAWALSAAAAYAIWPLFASGSIWPLADSLSVPLVATALFLFIWATRQAATWKAAVAGAFVGVSALIRPDLVLLIAPAALWMVLTGGEGRKTLVVALLVTFAIPIALWGLHNRRVHGAWVFGSTTAGLGLWEGLGEAPNAYGYVLDDSAANRVLMAKGYAWSSVEGDRYFVREYLNAWREHPAFVARTIARRVPRILFQSERLQPLFFGRARQLMDAIGALLVVAALAMRRRDLSAWLMLLVPPLYAVGSIGLIHYEPRYVRYVQLSYVLAAMLLCQDAWRRIERSVPLATVAASIVVALAGLYVARELRALNVAAIAAVAVP